jgi:hypothetical protein
VEGQADWTGASITVPASCSCVAGTEGCVAGELFSEGCYTKLLPHSIDMIVALGGAAFTIAGLEVCHVQKCSLCGFNILYIVSDKNLIYGYW